jgi:hypothetical protein
VVACESGEVGNPGTLPRHAGAGGMTKEKVVERRGSSERARAVVGAVGTSISIPFARNQNKSQPPGFVTYLSFGVVCGRKALKGICRQASPGSFDSAL